jgi:hypothetical protein
VGPLGDVSGDDLQGTMVSCAILTGVAAALRAAVDVGDLRRAQILLGALERLLRN